MMVLQTKKSYSVALQYSPDNHKLCKIWFYKPKKSYSVALHYRLQ